MLITLLHGLLSLSLPAALPGALRSAEMRNRDEGTRSLRHRALEDAPASSALVEGAPVTPAIAAALALLAAPVFAQAPPPAAPATEAPPAASPGRCSRGRSSSAPEWSAVSGAPSPSRRCAGWPRCSCLRSRRSRSLRSAATVRAATELEAPTASERIWWAWARGEPGYFRLTMNTSRRPLPPQLLV